LVEQLSALPERLRLAAVGQKAEMAQALQALGQAMQENAADDRVCWQGHGLAAITLASVVEGKAPLPVMHIDDTVVGEGHAMGRAPERVEYLRGSCHGPLGIAHPCLVIEAGDDVLQGLGGCKECRLL
jgi:hypothetical protein